MDRNDLPVLLTVEQVCKLTSVGRTLLYAEMASGALPARKIGRLTRIHRDDFSRWAAGDSPTLNVEPKASRPSECGKRRQAPTPQSGVNQRTPPQKKAKPLQFEMSLGQVMVILNVLKTSLAANVPTLGSDERTELQSACDVLGSSVSNAVWQKVDEV